MVRSRCSASRSRASRACASPCAVSQGETCAGVGMPALQLPPAAAAAADVVVEACWVSLGPSLDSNGDISSSVRAAAMR